MALGHTDDPCWHRCKRITFRFSTGHEATELHMAAGLPSPHEVQRLEESARMRLLAHDPQKFFPGAGVVSVTITEALAMFPSGPAAHFGG